MWYKVTLHSQLKYFKIIFLYIIIFSIASLWVLFGKNDDYKESLLIILITFLILILPLIVIHISYILENYNMKINIDSDKQILFLKNHRNELNISFKDIDYIVKYQSFPYAENRMEWLPWDEYNYSEIILMTGEKLNVTCFLIDSKKFHLEGVKEIVKKRFYPITH